MINAMIEPGWLIAAVAIVSAIVSAAIAVSVRPSRREVNEMIDVKFEHRMERLEVEVAEVKADVKTLLQRTAQFAGKRK